MVRCEVVRGSQVNFFLLSGFNERCSDVASYTAPSLMGIPLFPRPKVVWNQDWACCTE